MSISNPPNRPRWHSAHTWHSWSVPPGSFEGPLFSGQPKADPVQRPQTAAETVVAQLCDLGLRTYFGVPGGPIIPLFDAILQHPEARLIESRHETCGAFAA